MAKETKSLSVHPDDELEQINVWQTFGWVLFSTQEILMKDSHEEYGGYVTWSVTETQHYIKLTFQRDPVAVPHYNELRMLEQEYINVPGPGEYPKKLSKLIVAIGFLCYIIPGFIMLGKNRAIEKEQVAWERRFAEYKQKRQEILNRALALS